MVSEPAKFIGCNEMSLEQQKKDIRGERRMTPTAEYRFIGVPAFLPRPGQGGLRIGAEIHKTELVPEPVFVEKDLAAAGTYLDTESLTFDDVTVPVAIGLQIPEKGIGKLLFHNTTL